MSTTRRQIIPELTGAATPQPVTLVVEEEHDDGSITVTYTRWDGPTMHEHRQTLAAHMLAGCAHWRDVVDREALSRLDAAAHA